MDFRLFEPGPWSQQKNYSMTFRLTGDGSKWKGLHEAVKEWDSGSKERGYGPVTMAGSGSLYFVPTDRPAKFEFRASFGRTPPVKENIREAHDLAGKFAEVVARHTGWEPNVTLPVKPKVGMPFVVSSSLPWMRPELPRPSTLVSAFYDLSRHRLLLPRPRTTACFMGGEFLNGYRYGGILRANEHPTKICNAISHAAMLLALAMQPKEMFVEFPAWQGGTYDLLGVMAHYSMRWTKSAEHWTE